MSPTPSSRSLRTSRATRLTASRPGDGLWSVAGWALWGLSICLGSLAVGCSEARSVRAEAASPLLLLNDSTAYEQAQQLQLDVREPGQDGGLHNVFALSESIISGGEPHDRESLVAIAAMGVRTILSVDGKTPDAEGAAELGMRYVHVPIQYRGINPDELLKISKTFREAEGPFYVHCFHGQHRGPAAAAIGRLVLDAVPREQALAEMRQWCGTSEKYEGLYRTVATADIPSAQQTGALDWGLAAAQEFDGVRELMVRIARHFDNVAGMAKRDWTVNPDHPDVDPANEAAILRGLFVQARELPEVNEAATDYQSWIEDAIQSSATLREAYSARRASPDDDQGASAAAFSALKASCTSCHSAYRND